MPTATLTTKGQITLPKVIRDLWGLAPGDRVDFVIDESGRVELRPLAARAREAFGMLYRAELVARSVEDLDAARDAALAAEEARIRSDWQPRSPRGFGEPESRPASDARAGEADDDADGAP